MGSSSYPVFFSLAMGTSMIQGHGGEFDRSEQRTIQLKKKSLRNAASCIQCSGEVTQ